MILEDNVMICCIKKRLLRDKAILRDSPIKFTMFMTKSGIFIYKIGGIIHFKLIITNSLLNKEKKMELIVKELPTVQILNQEEIKKVITAKASSDECGGLGCETAYTGQGPGCPTAMHAKDPDGELEDCPVASDVWKER